jgi:uncharacterized protein YjbI with pentapeptide repeats
VLVGLTICSVLVFPSYLVRRDIGPDVYLTPFELARAKNDARTTLLQGIGGMLVLAGTAIGVVVGLRQLKLNREGQITERFTKAIEQLGHGNTQLDVTLGGIHALERIARDSPADRTAIAEVLSAYIRGHAPSLSAPSKRKPTKELANDRPSMMQFDAPDVYSALSVLSRFPPLPKPPSEMDPARLPPIMLGWTNLRGAHLPFARFDNAFLGGAYLERTYLVSASLADAYLMGAHFDGAELSDADLGHALSDGASFVEANLEGAYLVDAFLVHADLSGANLARANLEGAFLRGAKLTNAIITGANLRGITADHTTIWPDGFSVRDAEAAGVIFDDDQAT